MNRCDKPIGWGAGEGPRMVWKLRRRKKFFGNGLIWGIVPELLFG